MYPQVRQFQSGELHRRLVRAELERAGRARTAPRRARWLAAAVIVGVVAAAAYAAAANAAAVTCSAGPTTVSGSPARSFCGPATAAVAYRGRTYRFAQGECSTVAGFSVNIGTVVLGSIRKAPPYFGLALMRTRAGTYSGKAAAVSFANGVSHGSLAPNAESRIVLDRGLRSGSFAGRDLLGRAFSGTFHC